MSFQPAIPNKKAKTKIGLTTKSHPSPVNLLATFYSSHSTYSSCFFAMMGLLDAELLKDFTM